VARVIEYGARLVKMPRSSAYVCARLPTCCARPITGRAKPGGAVIGATDVQRAIDAKIFRSDRIRERLQEAIQRGTLLIDTSGERVGQVNGLSVVDLGISCSGHRAASLPVSGLVGRGAGYPARSRAVGPIHSKGVLILSGFLGARYAPERPLACRRAWCSNRPMARWRR